MIGKEYITFEDKSRGKVVLGFGASATPFELPSHQYKMGVKNKQNEDGMVVRNNVRLVAQGFCHKEGIDYEETFALIARLEVIRILLVFASSKGF
jgi:hypothetical protein